MQDAVSSQRVIPKLYQDLDLFFWKIVLLNVLPLLPSEFIDQKFHKPNGLDMLRNNNILFTVTCHGEVVCIVREPLRLDSCVVRLLDDLLVSLLHLPFLLVWDRRLVLVLIHVYFQDFALRGT